MLFTKICEFFSSLLLSLFQKILLSLFPFFIFNFVYYLLNFLFPFKFIVDLYFSGKLTAVGSLMTLCELYGILQGNVICSFPRSSFWNCFFLFHFLIIDMNLLLVAFQNLKLRLYAISHFRALASAIFQNLSFLYY